MLAEMDAAGNAYKKMAQISKKHGPGCYASLLAKLFTVWM